MKILHTIILIFSLNIFCFAQEISVKDGRLAFSTITAYENHITHANDTSYSGSRMAAFKNKKKSADTLIEDDFLAYMLNEKNMIEIAGKVYKIDFAEKLIYILSDVNDENLKLLESKNKSSGKLKVYSTDVDVLYLDEDSSILEKKILSPDKKGKGPNATGIDEPYFYEVEGNFAVVRCKDKGAPKRKYLYVDPATNNEPIYYNIGYYKNRDQSLWLDYKVHAKHVYQTAGIYFSLESKFKYEKKDSDKRHTLIWDKADTKLEGTWTYNYKPKCKDMVYNDVPYLHDPEQCTNRIIANPEGGFDKRIYHAGRALTEFKLNSEYTFLIDGCNDTDPPVTITLEEISYQ